MERVKKETFFTTTLLLRPYDDIHSLEKSIDISNRHNIKTQTRPCRAQILFQKDELLLLQTALYSIK